MNNSQDLKQKLDFSIQRTSFFAGWLVGPGPLVLTCEEFLGNTEAEIVKHTDLSRPDSFALPEVAADEFEHIFQWFLS